MLHYTVTFALCLSVASLAQAQPTPILSYAQDANGRVQIAVASTEDHYYVLHVRHRPTGAFEQAVTLVLGQNGATTLTETLAAYPLEHYQVTEHLKSAPADTDGDGLDDLTEWADLGAKSPFNRAHSIDFQDGAVCIPDRLVFKKLSYQAGTGNPDPSLDNLEQIKFFIKDRDEEELLLYFVNSNTYDTHTEFAATLGYHNDGTLMTGSILFHPSIVAPNGVLGVYRFVFQPNNAFSLAYVQKAMELLAANMPFLHNNLCYYPLAPGGLPVYWQEKTEYDASRVCVLLESDLFADVEYVALHPAEGYGLLRVMAPDDTPGARDVVLYESLPNDLPRVGGIISTTMQTPLSHVNLRAIQDNVPNAFIRDALDLPGIDSLLGRYVYFRAYQTHYEIRAASQAEVNDFYASIRPKNAQIPVRDLSKTKILPLDSIGFAASRAFGVKCANVATMRGFGFPDGTIPDGFGVPFYFYDAFMRHNGLYDQAQSMLNDALFQSDFSVRAQRLADFREIVKNASMPAWMLDELAAMQQSFPVGTSIRCRSSTNNEDLLGFSGAGLYDSKTQHPQEGHIRKSIQQVYASMWNLRAFEEREFYRIDHFAAAMGVLVHPNHENERANGVGVSTDPVYQTLGTYYLNTQIGDDLVTNPNAQSVPEEILLDAMSATDDDFTVMTHSNLVPTDSLVMKKPYLVQMRDYLGTIHRLFQTLYGAEDKIGFAMEIEYKINAAGQLTIKQARPWASFWAGAVPPPDSLSLVAEQPLLTFPNPFRDVLNVDCRCAAVLTLDIYNLLGQQVGTETIDFRKNRRQIETGGWAAGS